MASYLLDTCIALWHFEGSSRISACLQEVLTDPANSLFLSDVSLLEIVIQHRNGKLELSRQPSRLILPLARKHMMEQLPLTAADIFRLETLPLLHRDHFDRLLICQALENELVLVTPDPLIHQYQFAYMWA